MKIKLNGVEETLLIALWARAEETKRADGLIRDDFAVQLVDRIDYDFSKFSRAKHSQAGVAVRSHILDRETTAFIKKHPDAVCVNLACGLDTRFYRVDNGQIDWYNLDLPDVMKLRRSLLQEENARTHDITASVFDPDWIRHVEHTGRPVLILMEGSSMYFTEEQMRSLFSMLADAFADAVMLIEIMPPFLISQQKRHDSVDAKKAPFQWGVKSGKEIEKLHPSITFLKEQTFYEGFRHRWGLFGVLSLIPWWNRNCNDKIACLHFAPH
ncbi:class I SAM-dependent methyltransferase [Selenomonas sp. TAMA-11512]|uniref:class I SAM-dependent methyltransferase n=1 Tax=Selenomonas sp. TAMA-11512 TaxID=3095337 RepID=UPI00308FCC27|nr:class I SAM-dependent methyltransferase [Selenomonas sp. TAMA-11512]